MSSTTLHEMENPRAVRAADRHVREDLRLAEIERDPAADQVVDFDHLRGETKAPCAAVLVEMPAGAHALEMPRDRSPRARSENRVRNRRPRAGLRPNRARASEARRRSPAGQRPCCAPCPCPRCAGQIDRPCAREEPVEKRRARAAHVQIAGRRRSKTDSHITTHRDAKLATPNDVGKLKASSRPSEDHARRIRNAREPANAAKRTVTSPLLALPFSFERLTPIDQLLFSPERWFSASPWPCQKRFW